MADNIAIVEACYEAFGKGDIEALLALQAPDVVWVDNSPAASPQRGTYQGGDGILDLLGKVTGALDLEQSVDQLLRDGDTVVAVLQHKVTHKESGKVDQGRAVHVWHLAEGTVDHLEVFPPESEDFYN